MIFPSSRRKPWSLQRCLSHLVVLFPCLWRKWNLTAISLNILETKGITQQHGVCPYLHCRNQSLLVFLLMLSLLSFFLFRMVMCTWTWAAPYESLVPPLLVASVHPSSPKHRDLEERSNKHSCSCVIAHLLSKPMVARMQVEVDGFEVEV